jgi:hypothetical protein
MLPIHPQPAERYRQQGSQEVQDAAFQVVSSPQDYGKMDEVTTFNQQQHTEPLKTNVRSFQILTKEEAFGLNNVAVVGQDIPRHEVVIGIHNGKLLVVGLEGYPNGLLLSPKRVCMVDPNEWVPNA